MRLNLQICCLAIVAACYATTARAENPYASARNVARLALEKAKLELRLYEQVEYPRERRRLDAEITLTKARIDICRQRLREYRSYERSSHGGAFKQPGQEASLCLLAAELRLKDLQAERNALVRFRSDQGRLLELNVYEARVRVVELERAVERPASGPST